MGYQSGDEAPGRLKIRQAHPDMAYWTSQDLRQDDLDELKILNPDVEDGLEALADSIATSDKQVAVIEKDTDTIVGFIGWGQWSKDGSTFPNGYVWMIPTQTMLKCHFREITRTFRDYFLNDLLAKYGSVGNYIMNRNTVIRRWMSKAGFEDKETIEVDGHDFTMMFKALETN